MTFSLSVENVTYMTGMDLPPRYQDGQTVISLEAVFPNTQNEQAKALKRGSTAELTTKIAKWNELFSRLTMLVVEYRLFPTPPRHSNQSSLLGRNLNG